jgi:RNA polymerase sigma-70 factor, ECF subfamily
MVPVSHDFDQWLAAARAGSSDALGRSLDACRRYLLSIARHELDARLRAKGGASDMVQETFVEAQRAFDRFHGTSEVELRAWLRRLLHDRVAKFGRRYRTTQKRKLTRETLVETGDSWAGFHVSRRAELSSPSAHLLADEQTQQLREALGRLPADYERVIKLRFVENCSFEEIGQQMDRTANAARLLWLRAIERAKLEMNEHNER